MKYKLKIIQLKLSTTATFGTEESGSFRGGRCREVVNKSPCMDFLSAGTKKWPL